MEDVKIETMQEVLRRLTALETKFEKVIIHEREAKFEIRYLDLKEACTYLGIKKSSMYRLMQAGRIPYARIGAQRRFLVEDLDKLIQKSYKKVRPSVLHP